jgi:hypothetical protein
MPLLYYKLLKTKNNYKYMYEDDYFIDVGKDNNSFKLIIKDTSGNIAKVFDNTDYIVQQAWREVSQLIENYDLMIYGRVRSYQDGDFIFDLFKRYLFIISIEQDASYLASLAGYRIKYPEFTYYVATLYKLYKAFVNPRSTLSPQEFVLIIGPLLTKVRPDISGQELVSLFDAFAMNYYSAIDYINKERIGLNFMPAVERPMTAQPNTIATQPNTIATRPSTTVNQPKARSQVSIPRPVNNPPRVVPQRPPALPRVIPREKPEVTQPREETNQPTNQPKLGERKISLEERRPLGPPTIEEEPFENTQQKENLENRQKETQEETSEEVPEE